MTSEHTSLGARFMVGVRGARPGDPLLEADLDACVRAGIKGVVLFDRDVRTGGKRNVESKEQVRALVAYTRERLGDGARIAIDQEGGSVTRLKPEHGFAPIPTAREMSELSDTALRAIAKDLASDLRDVGIDTNFAPCVDLDLGSPVISGLGRSFGAREDVIRCASILIEEHEGAGVTACVKHFPGHGSAPDDSHEKLPDVTDLFSDLELEPYERLLLSDVPPRAVMTAHLLHRGLDPERPASLSRPITRMLRERFGFSGLIYTDSLDMGAVRRRFALADAARLALGAGADIVVHACNSPLGETAADVASVVEAIEVMGGA